MAAESPIEFRLELSESKTQPYFWRICKTDGGGLAYSETYESPEGANNAVHAVKTARTKYSIFEGEPEGEDKKKWWYFHIQALNNRILARSASKYSTKDGCEVASEFVRANVANAPYANHTGK